MRQPREDPAVIVRAAYVTAPLLVLAYGVIRIVDGFDGSRGPGPAWTIGHIAFLAALALFIVIFRDMWRILGRTRLATAQLAVGIAGIACAATQFLIDIAIGFMAADHAAMGPLFEQVQAVPGAQPVIYDVGPFLFYVAQLALVVHLAARRQVTLWTPALVTVDLALPLIDKDLMSVGAFFLLVSFWPLARRSTSAA
ncbi:hypothetical protein, partial [Nonomuraea longispora]|uniref:hypothetical protein n=1 Tax=Nonomuraea longispora TaxID=1848320 RepID=UPI0015F2E46D